MDWKLFAVTVGAVVVGLSAGKFTSQLLSGVGVPIAAGNPVRMGGSNGG